MPSTGVDPHLVRERFPALAGDAAYFDGPGGSQVPRRGDRRDRRLPARSNANLGGAFGTSAEADDVLERARAAAADFTGGEPEGIAFGANMTTLNFLLAHAVARTLEPGDEIVVTELDHDANVSPWLLVAADHDLVVRHAPIRPGDVTLDHDALEALIGERTRVVAFTLASNAVGSITDAGAHRRRGRAASARSRGPTPCTWRRTAACGRASSGLDVLLCSPYKFFGPHLGVAAIERRAGRVAAGRPRAAGRRVAARAPLRDRHPVARGDRRHDRRRSTTCARSATAASTPRSSASGSTRTRCRARFLEAPARMPGLELYGIADGARPSARPRSASTSGTGRRARWPSGSASATSTSGTATTTRSRRCARSGSSERGAVRAGFLHYTTEDEVDRLLAALTELAG